MPRARNDPYKRKSAQALNHLAAAILDINDIYLPFESQMKMLQGQYDDWVAVDKNIVPGEMSGEEAQEYNATLNKIKADLERYQQYVHDLYTVMMGIAAVREHIILFIGEVWNLDEESVKVYIS